jgi:phosphoglucosamine mutase
MSRQFFGTDGIRGQANTEPMTAETALKVGLAAASLFRRGSHRHRVVIGKDTRLSGYLIEPALTAGFISGGMDVFLVGPLPTPAVAMLTRSLRCDLGVMISASHNPYQDNGIKLFGPDGYKLSDSIELEIERLMMADPQTLRAGPKDLGRASRLEDARARYIEFAKGVFPRQLNLDGMRIVVDSAHGAAYKIAPTVLWELGADVISIGNQPDGFNINDKAGSTNVEQLRARVIAEHAHIGIALDGDADRVVLVDETGSVVDGDQILALIADEMAEAGTLRGGAIVGTVMSNFGLETYLRRRNIDLLRAPVGDRYVVEIMRTRGCNVGGEPSGHVVLSDVATTGDGLIAALHVLAQLAQTGAAASQTLRRFDAVPQKLVSVPKARSALEDARVKVAIAEGESQLNGQGRVLIRPSGTEPVIRVMAEGFDAQVVESVVAQIVSAIEAVA